MIRIEYKNIKNMYMRVDPVSRTVRISAPYGMSRSQIDSFIQSRQEWIERQLSRPAADASARDQISTRLKELIPYWEKRMNLHASQYTLRDMKTRWGSCNPQTGRICLNLQLAAYPEECLEYVLVHELAHLIYPGHTPEFWNYVEQYIPDWKKIRGLLR